MKEIIFSKIDESKDLIIHLQKELTSRPAINPRNNGKGEYEKCSFLKNYLQDWPFTSLTQFDVPDKDFPDIKRSSLLVTIDGNSTAPSLWIITHLDVVPPGDLSLWTHDPFSITIDGDRIYGRGTEDNQQSLVSSLVAIDSLFQNNLSPYYNVKLLFIADEETGSEYGIQWFLEERDDISPNDLVITPDTGSPQGTTIEIAEKSILWIEFKIHGKQCHASTPNRGINAARASAYLICKMDLLSSTFNAEDQLYDFSFSSFEPTKKTSTVENINTIPGEEIIYFDCRILPQYDLNDITKEIEKLSATIENEFDVTIDISYPVFLQAAPSTSPSSPIVLSLQRAVNLVTGNTPQPVGIGGGTVAAYFRKKGIDVALWSTIDGTLHGPDEYSNISNTITDAKVFAAMMCNF